jgi:uncharacterized phage protein gp47/JayE
MPGPYPLNTLSVTIDANGASAPVFEDILASLQASYQQIYGSDTDLAPDSQDGQWIAIQAQAIYDNNQAILAGYFSYPPTTAQGIGLSSVVKINGIKRLAPSNSTVEVLLVGQAGTQIINGIVSDVFGVQWLLPSAVVIPVEGQILETATAAVPGAIMAAPGSVTTMQTMVPGWQSVSNPQSAFPGLPLETDGTLRRRQTYSTALPALTPRETLLSAVANVPGVGRVEVYDNDTDNYDINLVPPHSVAVVVEGGDAQTIADTILLKKNTGCGTYGTTYEVAIDQAGMPQPINFFYLIEQPVWIAIAIQPLPGYLDTTGALIIAAVAEYFSTLAIGEDVYVARLAAPADLQGMAATAASETVTGAQMTQAQLDRLSATYVVRGIWIDIEPNPVSTNDVVIPFNAAASANPSNITLNLMQ